MPHLVAIHVFFMHTTVSIRDTGVTESDSKCQHGLELGSGRLGVVMLKLSVLCATLSVTGSDRTWWRPALAEMNIAFHVWSRGTALVLLVPRLLRNSYKSSPPVEYL